MNSVPTRQAKYIALFIVACVVFLCVAKCHATMTAQEREVVVQMKDVIKDLRWKLEDQITANNSALSSLSLMAVQATDLTATAKTAQDQAMLMTAERDSLKDQAIVREKKLADLNSKYQFAQFLIAGVTAFAVALLVFQFTRGVPPPYNILAPLGAAGVAYGIVTILI